MNAAHDVVITEHDCKTGDGLPLVSFVEGGTVLVDLARAEESRCSRHEIWR